MELQASLGVLSAAVDGCESHGLSVRTVDATTDDAASGRLRAAVTVAVELEDLAAGGAATDGDLQVTLSGPGLLAPLTETPGVADLAVESVDVSAGTVVVSATVAVEPARDEQPVPDPNPEPNAAARTAPETSDTTDAALAAARDDSIPAFEDTAYLRRLYETHDTFAAMSEAFEMDVSAETLRRYTIQAGVHDPDSYGTNDGSDADDPDPDPEGATRPADELLADGLGLPADLTVADVADAVVDARTPHEAARGLGLDHDRTRTLLRRLGLHEFVYGRVEAGPQCSRDAVVSRLRSADGT